jgi:hypothetical protein
LRIIETRSYIEESIDIREITIEEFIDTQEKDLQTAPLKDNSGLKETLSLLKQ